MYELVDEEQDEDTAEDERRERGLQASLFPPPGCLLTHAAFLPS